MPDKPLKSLWGSQGLESSSWTQPLERHDDETWKGQSSGQRTVFLQARTPSRGRTVLWICLYTLAWSMPSTLSPKMSCQGRQLALPFRDRRELKGASWVHGICMQVLTVWYIYIYIYIYFASIYFTRMARKLIEAKVKASPWDNGSKDLSKDSNQRPRPDSNRGPFDPKSDAVTDWPLRPLYMHIFAKTCCPGKLSFEVPRSERRG